MNFDLNVFNSVEAKEFGEFETLELGGHEIVIKKAEERPSKKDNKKLNLVIEVDIAGNDKQAGYFQKQFDKNTNMNKDWSTGATRYYSLNNENLKYLKGFITALEKSNSNFKFNTSGNWQQLVGLKCAGIFGLEEYEAIDGTIKTTVKLNNIRSLDKLPELIEKKVKLLNKVEVNYEEYKNMNCNNNASIKNDCVEISSEDLPF